MNAIICDLDGTLALPQNRDFYDASDCGQDLVNDAVAIVIEKFHKDTMPIFITGRSDKYRRQTQDWIVRALADRVENLSYLLFMRSEGDKRHDYEVKKEIYEKKVKNTFSVLFVLDDRNSIVKMWREETKLPCFQVKEGDF